jgi:hypothetical protein
LAVPPPPDALSTAPAVTDASPPSQSETIATPLSQPQTKQATKRQQRQRRQPLPSSETEIPMPPTAHSQTVHPPSGVPLSSAFSPFAPGFGESVVTKVPQVGRTRSRGALHSST